MNATHAKLARSEPVVIPESVDQCLDLLGPDTLVGLGDFAREAGFEETVLVSSDALGRMLGRAVLDGPPSEIVHAITDALQDLRRTLKRRPESQTLGMLHRTNHGECASLLVRRNLSSRRPFTLVTLP